MKFSPTAKCFGYSLMIQTFKLQSKLLRVIQDGEFERLGSSQTIKVDVRIISATNRNIE